MVESFSISLPHAQLKSLTMGKGVNIKPEYLDGSDYTLMVEEPNLKKLQKAKSGRKGFRLKLSDTEDIMNKTGGKLKGVKHLGKKVKSGIVKQAKEKKLGKLGKKALIETERGLLTAGTEVLLPAVATALTTEAGPVAQLGALSGAKILGDKLNEMGQKQIDKQEGGKIKGKKVAKKVGKVAKKVVKSKEFKTIAKTALNLASETAGQAITEKTGDSRLGDSVAKMIKSSGNTAIETGSAKEGLKEGKKSAIKEATNIAVEMVDDMIEEKFGKDSKITENVEVGLKGKFPEQSALVDDSKDITMGSGMHYSRRHQPIKYMKKGRMASPMGNTMGGAVRRHMADGMQTLVSGTVAPVRTVPNATVQTGSPYNRMTSPSNYPFISSSPQLMDAVSRGRMGGSLYPAGGRQMGGSIYPSGGRRMGGSMFPAGGSIYPAGRRRY